jgi:hypothetical protein
MVGPEVTDNRSDYRWLFDLTADYRLTPECHLGGEAVFGMEPDVGSKYVQGPFDRKIQILSGDDAIWYGAAGYMSYRFDEEGMYVGHLRGEWFVDGDGGRLLATEVWSLTGALAIRPFVNHEIGKNLLIRPEIRWDYSDQDIFDGYNRQSQITIGGDVVFTF